MLYARGLQDSKQLAPNAASIVGQQSTTRLSVAYKDCYGPFRTTGSHAEEDLSLKVTCSELRD